MHKSTLYILLSGTGVACVSIIYFFSLLLHIPLPLCIIFIIAIFLILGRYFHNATLVESPANNIWLLLPLAIGTFLITREASAIAIKHGEWDAWAMWNYHSLHLQDPENWQKMYQNIEYDHADYPLCVSGFLAFINRIFSDHYFAETSFAFGYFFALAVPIIIYMETAGRNILIGLATLYFFHDDKFYHSRMVAQYADTLLAFFFMGAFICINHLQVNKKMMVLTALLLGCCIWTKNEGIILAGIFCLFYISTIIKLFKYFLAGLALPFVTLVIYKFSNPVHSDMLKDDFSIVKQYIFSRSRYTTIKDVFKHTLQEKFNYLKFGVYIYLIMCMIQKRLPQKQFLIILTCLTAYLGIYVVTPHELEWHLNTSLDRLMHQLMPATMYVLANKFSEIRLPFSSRRLIS